MERWCSGFPINPCQVCKKCGSTLSFSPNNHKEPEPHDYEWRYSTTTGEKDFIECQKCYNIFKPKNKEMLAEEFNNKDLIKY